MDREYLALIIISAVVAIAMVGSFIKMSKGFGPFNLKVYGLTLVIGVGAILGLAGLPSEALTPPFSILGAIAGYLFGLKNE